MANRKRRIQRRLDKAKLGDCCKMLDILVAAAAYRRLDKAKLGDCCKPMFTASTIRYEIGDRRRGIAYGGIGAFHALAHQIGLIDALDNRLHLLKLHLPFHESDHVLNFVYNAREPVNRAKTAAPLIVGRARHPIRYGWPSHAARFCASAFVAGAAACMTGVRECALWSAKFLR